MGSVGRHVRKTCMVCVALGQKRRREDEISVFVAKSCVGRLAESN